MIVEDFVMLGRTVPEESKKHGLTVCSAGYSKEIGGLLRVYPLPMQNGIRKWSRCKVPLRRNATDNRRESWRINSMSDDVRSAAEMVQIIDSVKKDAQFDFLKSLAVDSIAKLNEQRASLAIVSPDHIIGYFEPVKGVDPYYQETLFDRVGDGKIDVSPRLRFWLSDGEHKLQLREWGCWELLRKDRDKAHEMWDRLKISDPAYEHLLFIGNMNQYRNNWLIISTVSRRRQIQDDLFAA